MIGPVHEVETSYEPHRNLFTGVVNRSRFAAEVGSRKSEVGGDAGAPVAPAPAADSEPSTKNQEPRTLSSYLYANDLLGRRETISQGGEAFGMLKLGHNQVEVAYNDRSEVVGAVYRSNTETRQNFEYTFDAIGNRERTASEIESKRSELSYETNALNQYKKVSANQRQLAVPYDLDGNLLEDARNTYTRNADNNLIRVDAKDGSLRLDYIYDHQSRRIVRTETTNPGKETESRRTTYFVYDDWNLLAELESSTGSGASEFGLRVSSFLTWSRDLSGSLQGAGGVGGLLAITKRNAITSPEQSTKNQGRRTDGETRFAIFDANGNIGQLVDTAGTVVAAYAYDPFGNVTEMAGAEAAENPWRFSTKPVEAGTGWLYYGYRWYDAEMGRWVNRDPIEERGGVNLYRFVGASSIDRIDLLGLREIYLLITGDSRNHDGSNGPNFQAAAQTKEQEIRSRGSFTTCDEVVISDVRSASQLNSELQNNEKIVEIHFFVQATPKIIVLDMPSTDAGANIGVNARPRWRHPGAPLVGSSWNATPYWDLDKSNVNQGSPIYVWGCFSGGMFLGYELSDHLHQLGSLSDGQWAYDGLGPGSRHWIDGTPRPPLPEQDENSIAALLGRHLSGVDGFGVTSSCNYYSTPNGGVVPGP